MNGRDLRRAFVAAVLFSTAILLILGISEAIGQLWFGGYFFIFAVVAFGMMEMVGVDAPRNLPVIVAWLTLLPAMIVFYTPVALLLIILWRNASASLRGKSEPVAASGPN